MAANGLINGNIPARNAGQTSISPTTVGNAGVSQAQPAVPVTDMPPLGEHPPYFEPQSPAQPEIDAGQLFAQWLEQNPDATPQEIFSAGLNTGLSGGTLPPPVLQDGMGLPTGAQEFIPPLDEFGPDVAPIPGMGTPTGPGFSTKTPYNPNLAPHVPPPQNGRGVPTGGIAPEEERFVIDLSEFD